MTIEELVKKYWDEADFMDRGHFIDALTEQAEAFKGELQSYDGMVRELTKTVEDMQAAQSVPVVGDVVNIPVMQQVTPELASLAYQRAFNGDDSVDFSLRIARHVAVLLLCVDSITAAELATLREKAAMADELRKDAEIAVSTRNIALNALQEIIDMDYQDNLADAKLAATKAMTQLAAIAQGKGE